jgi:hypothetical protein
MGNCFESKVSNKELKFNFDKRVTAQGEQFKIKEVDVGAQRFLSATSVTKAPQLARTYKKDSVRVTVF